MISNGGIENGIDYSFEWIELSNVEGSNGTHERLSVGAL